MKRLIIHYGVFAILALMCIGLFFLLRTLSIRQKSPVQLFITGPQTARAYLTPGPDIPRPTTGDTLHILQTTAGDMTFVIERLAEEPGELALTLRPLGTPNLGQTLGGHTHTSGYVYTGRTPLMRLVLEKVKR